jgi:hypothetical protein
MIVKRTNGEIIDLPLAAAQAEITANPAAAATDAEILAAGENVREYTYSLHGRDHWQARGYTVQPNHETGLWVARDPGGVPIRTPGYVSRRHAISACRDHVAALPGNPMPRHASALKTNSPSHNDGPAPEPVIPATPTKRPRSPRPARHD